MPGQYVNLMKIVLLVFEIKFLRTVSRYTKLHKERLNTDVF